MKNPRSQKSLSKISELLNVKQKTAIYRLGYAKKAQGNNNRQCVVVYYSKAEREQNNKFTSKDISI